MTRGSPHQTGSQTRRARVATLALAASLVAASVTAASLASFARGSPPPRLAGESELSALLWPGPASPAAAWIDQTGRAVMPASLQDKIVVLAFVSADCLITCVVRAQDLDTLARALPGRLRDRTAFLAVGVDPGRDDSEALRGFAEGLGIGAARLRLITGDTVTTAALIASLHYPAAKLPEPPPTVLVFDRRGRVAMSYGTDPLDRPRLLRDLALIETFEDGIGRPARSEAPEP